MDSQDPTGSADGPGVVTSVPCPACGVSVAVGYPRCPKCHAPVPQPAPRRARRQTARDDLAGGTSVEPEPAGLGGWLVIGAVVVAAIALVVYAATRDDEGAAPAARDDEGAATADDDEGAGGEDDEATGGGEGDDAPFRPRTPAGQPLRDAVRALDADLRAERVWSKVASEGDVVIIESAMCADPAMPPVLNAHVADLAAGGAVALRCQEPHGAVVFETDL